MYYLKFMLYIFYCTFWWHILYLTFYFEHNYDRNNEHTLFNSSATSNFQLFKEEKSVIVMFGWNKLLMIDTTYLPPFSDIPSDKATVSVTFML